MKTCFRIAQLYVLGAWVTALASCSWSCLFCTRGWYDLVAAALVASFATFLLAPLVLVLGNYARIRRDQGGIVI